MYTLIGNPQTRAFRVLWALEELGLNYEVKNVAPHSEEIRAVNPGGKLPALMAEGQAITDSVAIIQYLADKHGALTHPAGTLQRAQQDSFTQMFCDELDGTCWVLAKHSFVLPKEMRNKDAVKAGAAWDISRALKALEARIGDGPWLTGDTFTVADLILTHCCNWIEVVGLEQPAGKTAAILERAKARPAYVRSLEMRENS